MTARLERLTQQRLEKLKRIRARGIDPYPHSYKRSHTTHEAVTHLVQQEKGSAEPFLRKLSLAGRIVASRFMGKAAFFDIRDGSGKIQLYFRLDQLGDEKYQLLRDLDIGDIIGVEGTIFRTKTGEPTVDVSEFTILTKSLQPLPEKWHGLVDVEKRYRQRYLDLISNEEVKPVFVMRSKVIAAIRQFLDEQGFVEVETPILQSVAGGALARPFVTHHQALGQDLYLRIALELSLKRLIVGGFDKVYEIGRAFRNEGISIRHNPEFTMLESYQAYADYEDIMHLFEEMVFHIAKKLVGGAQFSYGGTVIDVSPPWQRLSLREAVKKHCGIDFEEYTDTASLRTQMQKLGMEVDPNKSRGRLVDELITTFIEPNLVGPTFLLDYPVEMSPLAKRKRGNERLVERFEAFIGGMEIANAFSELNDPIEQRQRFQEQMEDRGLEEDIEAVDEDFLVALEYGMPPCGGLGVGIDRLVMLFADRQSIREVILFPQLRTKE